MIEASLCENNFMWTPKHFYQDHNPGDIEVANLKSKENNGNFFILWYQTLLDSKLKQYLIVQVTLNTLVPLVKIS